jgi:hypothetical protein
MNFYLRVTVSILRFFLIFVKMGCTFEFLSRKLSAVLIIQEILIVLKNDFCDIERCKQISILQISPEGRVLKNPRKLLSYIPRYFLYKMAQSHSSTVSINITINCQRQINWQKPWYVRYRMNGPGGPLTIFNIRNNA